jgi:hypothetical protein
MEKVSALGFMILAAQKLNLAEGMLKSLVEGMRSELMITPEQLAMDQFFKFDSLVQGNH